MKRAIVLLLLSFAALLAGCGKVHHVFPPDVSVQQLHLSSDGSWHVTLRLRNYSYDASVHFDHVHAALAIGATPAVIIDVQPDIDVAQRDSDITRVTVHASAASSSALRAARAAAGDQSHSVAYTLKGKVGVSDADGHAKSFPIDRHGWLSPAPGLANTWR